MFKPAISELRANWLRPAANCAVFGVHIGYIRLAFRLTSNNEDLTAIVHRLVARPVQELNRHATIHWLNNKNPVLDYANAMVHRRSGTPDNWQEHITGMPSYNPVIPPKAPNRFTGGLYLKGNMANCTNFLSSEQWQHADYVHTVTPAGAGVTNGMLGYMFWAAEYPSARKNYVATIPPNSCENGMGVAADIFDIPIPMPPLRDE